MKVFISADMEGTCGITTWPETERSTGTDYVPYQKLMTGEVVAACEGAIAGGATDILVKDAHDSARNIDTTALPKICRILRGWTGDLFTMMSGLDDSFDAVGYTGYHSEATALGNPLSHTMNGENEYVLINGRKTSEFLMNTYTAAYCKVPVVFVSGDQQLCDFAKELIPAITTVPVNQGRGGGVLSIHPAVAVERIRAGMAEAVQKADQCHLTLPEHFEVTIRFREHKAAYSKQFYPQAWLEEGKNVCFASDDWYEVLRFLHFVLGNA